MYTEPKPSQNISQDPIPQNISQDPIPQNISQDHPPISSPPQSILKTTQTNTHTQPELHTQPKPTPIRRCVVYTEPKPSQNISQDPIPQNISQDHPPNTSPLQPILKTTQTNTHTQPELHTQPNPQGPPKTQKIVTFQLPKKPRTHPPSPKLAKRNLN